MHVQFDTPNVVQRTAVTDAVQHMSCLTPAVVQSPSGVRARYVVRLTLLPIPSRPAGTANTPSRGSSKSSLQDFRDTLQAATAAIGTAVTADINGSPCDAEAHALCAYLGRPILCAPTMDWSWQPDSEKQLGRCRGDRG
jgi:hypothetical protein